MTSEKWQQIKSIFNQAVELGVAEREDFLAAAGADEEILAEVRKMFAADEDSLIVHSPFTQYQENGNAPTPEKIGRYRVIREIGRGGMGAVYEGARDDGQFAQRVAVKIIKRGMDSDEMVRRFRNERQILAELQHPNIARLFDGGVNESGSPFYVMEFIEGAPIDGYAWENKLTATEKLELFLQVCAAVSYAHSQLVVHRDLKPSNILITKDRTVKLLDFGIAKVLNANAPDSSGTATQLGMMTPAYASPEQIRGEKVTTVSDVYSLGVVLYELLTGERPYRTDGKSYPELLELIAHTQPRKPSETASVPNKAEARSQPKNVDLKGDLDNIVLKALQKDPERRYRSVEQFSEDIRRYLSGQTVTARSDTFSYRLSKFVGRNKVTVIAGSLIFLSLCAGITVAVWQAQRAEHQRAMAERRFAEVRELANSVIFKYHDAIAALPGSTTTREMLVKDASKYLDSLAKESAEDPALQRELALAYIKLGDVQGKAYAANTGNTVGAVESYRKAVALLENAVATAKDGTSLKFELVKAYDALFQIYMRTSDPDKLPTLEKALKLQDELLAVDPANAAYKLEKTALLILSGDATGTIASKLPVYEQALALGKEMLDAGSDDKEIIRTNMRINQRIGGTYNWLGDEAVKKNDQRSAVENYVRALPFYETSFELAKKLFEAESNNISYQRNFAMASINLAESYAKTGKRGEALTMIERCRKILAQMEAEDKNNKEIRSDVAYSYEAIAGIWKALGEQDRAAEELEKALQIQQNIYADDKYNTEILGAISRNLGALAATYEEAGERTRATALRQTLERYNTERLNSSGK